jgi:hypothetical protein
LRVNKRGRKPKSNPIKETLQNNQPGFDITKLMEDYKVRVQEFLKNEICGLPVKKTSCFPCATSCNSPPPAGIPVGCPELNMNY